MGEKGSGSSSENVFWVVIRFWYVVCIGILLLVSSVAFDEKTFAHHILRDVGIASIVSYIVIVTIEHRQRTELSGTIEKFLGATNEKIFQTILGVEFPRGMFDFVRDTVMREDIFRTNTQVIYRIEALPNTKHVSLDFDTTHMVCNLSGSQQVYRAKFFVEKPLNGGMPSDKDLEAIELYVDDVRVSTTALAAADAVWADTEAFVRFNYRIDLKPRQKVKVRIRFKLPRKLASDSEVWRSIIPCDGVNFVINFPNWLSVQMDGIHVDGAREICRTDTVICGAIDRPLYPHNGFMFWWSPRDGDFSEGDSSNGGQIETDIGKP